MQVLKDIYQVSGSLNGITWCENYGNYDDSNVYLLKTPYGLIMFDTGNGDTLDQIIENMDYWALDVTDIKGCFITHPHLDHAGGAYGLQKLGIPLYAHTNTASAIAAGDNRCAGYLYHKEFKPCKVDISLENQDIIELCGIKIKALHFPGHTMGCTAYEFDWGRERIIISGDIIGTLLDGYFGWNGSFDFNREAYMDSLIRFSKYDFDVMLPGHGMVYYGKPRKRIEAALNQALMEWR